MNLISHICWLLILHLPVYSPASNRAESSFRFGPDDEYKNGTVSKRIDNPIYHLRNYKARTPIWKPPDFHHLLTTKPRPRTWTSSWSRKPKSTTNRKSKISHTIHPPHLTIPPLNAWWELLPFFFYPNIVTRNTKRTTTSYAPYKPTRDWISKHTTERHRSPSRPTNIRPSTTTELIPEVTTQTTPTTTLHKPTTTRRTTTRYYRPPTTTLSWWDKTKKWWETLGRKK